LIQQNVVGKDRQKKVLKILDEYNDQVKEIRKKEKDLFNLFKRISEDRNVSKEKLNNLFKSLISLKKQGANTWLHARKKTTTIITQAEFKQIIVMGTDNNKKAEKRNQKAADKRGKTLSSINTAIKETIADKKKREVALSAFNEFKTSFNLQFDTQTKINYKSDETLNNYNATDPQLQDFVKNIGKYYKDSFDAYQAFHFKLADQTTDQEWKTINKKVMKLVK